MENQLMASETKIEQKQARKITIKERMMGEDFKQALSSSLPAHITPERFIRVALTSLLRIPKLSECSEASLFKCMLDLSSMGLEPDGRRAHIIPYNTKNGGVEAQLIIDYKGIIELAKRSGEIKIWRAEMVCENDEFSWENGIVTHRVNWLKPRGKSLAVYSHVRNQLDVDDYEVMTMDQVESVRKRSKAGHNGPWVTDFDEMAKKTVIRRHSKRLTLSPEFSDAISKDDDRIEDYAQINVSPQELMPKAKHEIQEIEKIELKNHTNLINESQIRRLIAISKENGVTLEQLGGHILDKYSHENIFELNVEEYEDVTSWAKNIKK